MRINLRTASGVFLMLGILPILAGLLACMPEYVPLGNPERSRINPQITGVWHVGNGMEPLLGQILYFQPWDKRTWLVSNVAFEIDEEEFAADANEELPGYDLGKYEDLIEFLREEDLDAEGIDFSLIVYKAWVTKLGGQTFLVLDWRGLLNDDEDTVSHEPFFWMDFRVAGLTGETMELHLIDPQFEPLKEAPATRRGWEKVIRKHVDNPGLYDEEIATLRRIDDEDGDLVSEMIFYGFTRDTF